MGVCIKVNPRLSFLNIISKEILGSFLHTPKPLKII